MNVVAITGGSGFIGSRFVPELVRLGAYRVKVLSRSSALPFQSKVCSAGVELVQGDLREPASLQGFLEPGCTVVNFVYLWDAGERVNLEVTQNLLAACTSANVRRLIHCSTAAVVGRVPDDLITEDTPCRPITDYGTTKLKIESIVREAARGRFDVGIVRPTAVFGPGGEPLKKLAADLTRGNRLLNYLKSCLFGARRMNLVHVANVVAAIVFLIDRAEALGGEVFIVSDDHHPDNNFASVERFLMAELRVPDYRLPRLRLPLGVLNLLLSCMGRNNPNPRAEYRSSKLDALGFRPPVTFDAALAEYAQWYRSSLH